MAARKPITIVEIDLPYCTRTYGSSPCAAVLGTTGAAKCFNSRFTCQDPANYAAGTKTVSFCYNQDGIPDIPGIFPALVDVSSRPGELNLSGIDPRSTALGIRARVTVRLHDFTNNDTWLDKYQSERVSGAALASGVGYNPLTRGNFLRRMMARFPYYLGIPLRVKRGYVGDAPASMPTEHYVISEVTGPNAAGVVQITAKDVLDLAENEKAVCPAPSSGKLLAAITDTDTTATLTPEGIGSTYAASGIARIGRELVAFTRVDDVLTITRAQEGTQAASHSALDVVQECAVFDGETIAEAAERLLVDCAGVDAAFVDAAAWAAENDTWYGGITVGRVIITKPTGVKTLIGELCQLGVLIWWDPVGQEVKFKVSSPLLPGEEYYPIDDESGLIQDSPDVDRSEDQRISALWFYHGVRDWTSDSLSPENMNNLAIASVSENLYGQEAYKEIFTRWFGREGDDATVGVIAERLLSRFINPPKVISGALDVKDRSDVSLGARVLVETYLLEDIDGAILAEPMQVNYAEYSDGRVNFKAETYRFNGRFGFWLDSSTAPTDYTTATAAQRARGAFWGDETQETFSNGDPFYVWF